MPPTQIGNTLSATNHETSTLSRRELWGWSTAFGLLTLLIHLPFVYRYDLFLGSDSVINMLIDKRILIGELGAFPWGADYNGKGPVSLLNVLAYAIFGCSIPLTCFLSLFAWSIGVSLLVWYTASCFGKSAAIASGFALAIGMPFFLSLSTIPLGSMYNTTPYTIGLFFILTTSLLRRGPQSKLCILTAFLMGWHWYFHKSVLIIWLSIGIGLLTMPQGRDFLNRFVRSRMLLFSIIAFTVGYSPEIAFKLGWIGNHAIGDRTSSLHLTEGFFKMASPSLMARNWYMVFRSIPTFFDADPWSRSFTSTHYLNHMENWESFPLSAGDTIGIMAAIVVISFILKLAIQSYREKKLELFILAICPFVNVLMVVLASQSSGGYYNIRRYLLPGGVVCVLWLGVCLSRNLKMRNWAVAGLLILLLAFSAFNQWKLLQLPDELVDYRKTLQQIEDAGYKYGISWYHYTHLMTGLSNEKVIFASLDYNFISPYQQQVLQQDTVVLLWPARNPPPYEFAQKLFFGEIRMKDDTVHMMPETITVLGVKYHRIAEPTITGELGWAPYRKLG